MFLCYFWRPGLPGHPQRLLLGGISGCIMICVGFWVGFGELFLLLEASFVDGFVACFCCAFFIARGAVVGDLWRCFVKHWGSLEPLNSC